MFLSYSSSIWFLFVSLLDFLYQSYTYLLFLVFDEIIVFWRFLFVFILLFCVAHSYFYFFCVVTCWFLVFCIFIYSCNYIFVFFSISSRLFCITALSDVVFSRCFPHKLLSLSSYIFVLFVVMFSFAFLLSLVLFASFILDIFIFVCGYRIII